MTFSNCSDGGPGSPTNGTVSEKDAEVVKAIYRGAFDSQGDQIFWTYRNGTTLTVEAAVKWNYATESFESGQNFFFGTYYQNLVLKNTVAPIVDYTNITVDYIYELMQEGLEEYGSFTETTYPDLTRSQANGGKLIHWHGEQDTNLYPEASAHFHEKVRGAMFPNSTGYDEINDFLSILPRSRSRTLLHQPVPAEWTVPPTRIESDHRLGGEWESAGVSQRNDREWVQYAMGDLSLAESGDLERWEI